MEKHAGQDNSATGVADPDSVQAYYRLESGDTSRPGDGLRFSPVFDGAQGFRELIEVCPGLHVLLGDLHYDTCVEISMREDATLKFHYRLSGVSDICVTEEGVIRVGDHTGGVLLHPDGVVKQERYEAGQHEKSVTLICSQRFMAQRLATCADALPGPIAEYARGSHVEHYSEHVPLRASMASAAAQLFALPASGPARALMMEAKALELLALSIESICDRGAAIADNPGLSGRDLNCLQQARRMLEEQYLAPPTIGSLARAVGINEAKLMHSFKQLFGQTIFDFTQSLRMEEAKSLLERTELSITEIAFEVGYEYSSNFTTAFKRHFGITPSVAREALRPRR